MSVVLQRPYQYVPPHRGNLWPSFIQTFRIVDYYLKKKEGVVAHQCRDLHHWQSALDRGDGILLAPNHCRYADPLVLGWPARDLRTHVYAMASWHLFNKGTFDAFAIQKMGAFSINREGADRQSLETAIDILASSERPLVLFPEGTTNRTNDVLKPLLEGVAFIARAAARRRAKQSGGRVVMLPIALKYLCVSDITQWADRQLSELEQRFGWRRPMRQSILGRTVRIAEALLSLKEIEYLGCSKNGPLPQRRDQLIKYVLGQAELRLGMAPTDSETRDRVRAIRAEVVSRYFASSDAEECERLRADVAAAELAQELMSYPDCYLQVNSVTDTRIVETIQRMQESLLGKADSSVPLRVVIQCDTPIVVPPEKAPRSKSDPLMVDLGERLTSMVAALSGEARLASDAGLA